VKHRKVLLPLLKDDIPTGCGIWYLIYSKLVLSPVDVDRAAEGNIPAGRVAYGVEVSGSRISQCQRSSD